MWLATLLHHPQPCILPQHLGSIAGLSLLLVPELTPLVLPSKAFTPLIAAHIQLVAQYTHLKLGHISYASIYSLLNKLIHYLVILEKILGSFHNNFSEPYHISMI